MTPGYWNRPEATEAAFHDGGFRTGDVGRRDAEGYFYIQDRLKDMYISGGENVYPAEVENVLYELEAIAEVAVIGMPHDQWGECGCAVVVPKDGHAVGLDLLVDHCAVVWRGSSIRPESWFSKRCCAMLPGRC